MTDKSGMGLAGVFCERAGFYTLTDMGVHLATALTHKDDCPGQVVLVARFLSRRFGHDAATDLLKVLTEQGGLPCDCSVLEQVILPVSRRLAVGTRMASPDLGLAVLGLASALDVGGWYRGGKP